MQFPRWQWTFSWFELNFTLLEFVLEVDIKPTIVKRESPSSSSIVQESKTDVKPVVEKKIRAKKSPPSSPSIKPKKRPAAASASVSSKEPINDDNNQYSQHELEMETKLADYFHMNCDLCMHRFSSWSDARSHYLNRHNVLKPFLRCCNRKYFLRSRIIEHIIWHVDPSSFWYKLLLSILFFWHTSFLTFLFHLQLPKMFKEISREANAGRTHATAFGRWKTKLWVPPMPQAFFEATHFESTFEWCASDWWSEIYLPNLQEKVE